MSHMSELHLAIKYELEQGTLSFYQIAQKLEIPVEWVIDVNNEPEEVEE